METDYAYLAGVIDSDGHITVQRTTKHRQAPSGHQWSPTYYTAKVGISGTRPAPHELAKALFGGGIHMHQPPNPAHRAVYNWSISGPAAARMLRRILPYLRVKRDQAELAIQFADMVTAQFEQTKATQKPPYRVTEAMTAERERLWAAVTALNEPRNRRVHFATT